MQFIFLYFLFSLYFYTFCSVYIFILCQFILVYFVQFIFVYVLYICPTRWLYLSISSFHKLRCLSTYPTKLYPVSEVFPPVPTLVHSSALRQMSEARPVMQECMEETFCIRLNDTSTDEISTRQDRCEGTRFPRPLVPPQPPSSAQDGRV